MTTKKTTIIDIANALGMSRNTISKALNGSGNVSDKNRESILSKAKELNYKGFINGNQKDVSTSHSGNIVFLTSNFTVQELFWPFVVKGIEEILSQANYNFSIKLIREDDLMKDALPLHFNASEIDGIICTELYHKPYIDKLVATNIPLVLIDSVYDVFEYPLTYDIVLMENNYSIQKLTTKLMELGHEKIGFVGQINHCRSFYERFIGFNQSFTQRGLVVPTAFNIIPDNDNYSVEWLMQKLKGLAELPTALVCANDAIAINVMTAAKCLDLRIPEDLSVTGYDDISEASLLEPHLTTVNIQKEALGNRAAEILLWRIQNPMRPFSITYIENVIHFRDSVFELK
jgi:LacI family transcriptional regulator